MEASMSIACVERGAFAETAAVRGLPSDEALLEKIATGDQAALRMLAERHQAKVYRFALRFVGDRSLAEDVVSETFFAVWRQSATFRNRSAVGTWILSIARYRALSLRDRHDDGAEPLDEDVARAVPDPAHRADAALERTDLVAFIRQCLRRLPVEQAMLIDLVYLRERPIKEAAMIAGVPLNTVKSRMFLARKKLAGMLAAAGIDGAARPAFEPA
jgi:RNA polymerase sigma-70 factor (ECF subfamily)